MAYKGLGCAMLAYLLVGCARTAPPPTVPQPPAQPAQLMAPPPTVHNGRTEHAEPLPLDASLGASLVGEYPEPAWLLAERDRLGLTDSQIKTIKSAQSRYMSATREDRALIQQTSEAFLGQLGKSPTSSDQAKLNALEDRVREADARLIAERRARWEPLWHELTDAQKRQVQELRAADPFRLR